MEAEAPRRTIPLFKTKRYIGRGSFGTTFAATKVGSGGREVALKVIECAHEVDVNAAFIEARALQKMSSHFIVRLFDAFVDRPFSTTLVCEYCDGGTLHAAGEGDRRSARFETADGRIYCDNFVVFFYL